VLAKKESGPSYRGAKNLTLRKKRESLGEKPPYDLGAAGHTDHGGGVLMGKTGSRRKKRVEQRLITVDNLFRDGLGKSILLREAWDQSERNHQ